MTTVAERGRVPMPYPGCPGLTLLLGQWLVRAAIVLAVLWLMQVARALTRQEVRAAPPSAPDTA